jgi:hypothetical protein
MSSFANINKGDTLYFLGYVQSQDKIFICTDTLVFKHQTAQGSVGNPVMLDFTLSPKPVIYTPSDFDYSTLSGCNTIVDIESSDNTDEEGSGLTYSIIGGADQSKFSVDASTGVLSWNNFTPNANAPADANTDNIYEVRVKVTDSNGLTGTQTMRVSGEHPECDNLLAELSAEPVGGDEPRRDGQLHGGDRLDGGRDLEPVRTEPAHVRVHGRDGGHGQRPDSRDAGLREGQYDGDLHASGPDPDDVQLHGDSHGRRSADHHAVRGEFQRTERRKLLHGRERSERDVFRQLHGLHTGIRAERCHHSHRQRSGHGLHVSGGHHDRDILP